jgi:hypothetical protein
MRSAGKRRKAVAAFLDNCRFVPTAGATTDWTYSSAVGGCQSPSAAGAVNGTKYKFLAIGSDLTQWEIAEGTYNSGTGVFQRTTVLYNSSGTGTASGQSGAGTKINFTAIPQVAIIGIKEDLISIEEANSFTATQQARAMANLGLILPPQGRLTLQSGTPVMTTTQGAKTTVFYTPDVGGIIPIYDGAVLQPTPFSEISVATADTTKNPAAIGASKVNDWFVWNDAGIMRLAHGPDWTSDTVRSAGTALVRINGLLTNSVAITNGPGVSKGTYVGTTRSNASSQIDYIFGAAASGGTAAFFGVWNCYNRVTVAGIVQDNGAAYTYASSTARQARGSAGNQVSFVTGLAEDAILSVYTNRSDTVAASGAFVAFQPSLDSTSSFQGQNQFIDPGVANTFRTSAPAVTMSLPQLGFHFVAAIEQGDGTNANTVNPGSLATLYVQIKN